MSKKFEMTDGFIEYGARKLHRIKALKDFGYVKAGDIGGYIEKESNLSHDGNAWVCGNAKVYGDARICGDARINDNAEICGNARVYGDARICGNAEICGNARVYGDAWIYGNAKVSGDAKVYNADVSGDARVYSNAEICNADVGGDARVSGDAEIKCSSDYTTIKGFGSVCRNTTFFRCKGNLVKVTCGCFYGTIDEFRNKVKETHGNSKYAKEYLMIADLMELHFAEE